jgi:hypothetical protein
VRHGSIGRHRHGLRLAEASQPADQRSLDSFAALDLDQPRARFRRYQSPFFHLFALFSLPVYLPVYWLKVSVLRPVLPFFYAVPRRCRPVFLT